MDWATIPLIAAFVLFGALVSIWYWFPAARSRPPDPLGPHGVEPWRLVPAQREALRRQEETPIRTLGEWRSASTMRRMKTARELVDWLKLRGELPPELARRFRTEQEMGYLAGELMIALSEAARVTEEEPEMGRMRIEHVARAMLMLMAEDKLDDFNLDEY